MAATSIADKRTKGYGDSSVRVWASARSVAATANPGATVPLKTAVREGAVLMESVIDRWAPQPKSGNDRCVKNAASSCGIIFLLVSSKHSDRAAYTIIKERAKFKAH
jgi:hypothetical protein